MGEPSGSWVEIARTMERRALDERSLVLEAMRIPNAVVHVDGAHVLVVRAEDAPRARGEIEGYLSESRERATAPPPAPLPAIAIDGVIAYAILLGLAFLLQRGHGFGLAWRDAGAADAEAIRGGAWWRAITALFLHADLVHLAGNVLFGGVFLVMLSQSVGLGGAAFAFVLGGGLANGLNAWAQDPSHVSIGASTGVFTLLGCQVAHDWTSGRRSAQGWMRRLAPVVIGAALLAWIGGGPRPDAAGDWPTGAERVDVGAHVLGFALGLALGAVFGWVPARVAADRRIQAALGAVAIGAIGLAWWLAL